MDKSAQRLSMLNGVAAATVGVGVAELAAAPLGPSADALIAVGSSVIDLAPGPLKEWAIQAFGTADKLFLVVTIVAVIAVIGAIVGLWERRRRPAATAVIVLAVVAGCAAVLSRPGARHADVIPTIVGACCAVGVLRAMTRWQSRRAATASAAPKVVDPSRRLWLTNLGLITLGALGGASGVALIRRLHSVAGERSAFTVPPVIWRAPPIPPAVQPKGIALPSFVTTNDKFYRIDTALAVPQLSRNDWRLHIHGMVDRETTYTFNDLQSLQAIEKAVTLTCVSNPVGGDLISNAVWSGYRVKDLFARAGVHPDADMVLSRSIDGFTAGTPLEALTDDRDALLAITMNGEPLPTAHGYPARLVVPGLYGYVSATKWVVDLAVTRFDRAQGYWTRLGWSERAPIKTASRIDLPRNGAQLRAGPITFGGVAWAQPRGIRTVEVRVDDQQWRTADLAADYSNDTWRLWTCVWDVTPGSHTVTVRATDKTGALQTPQESEPAPDGATGWHSISFIAT